MLAQVVLTTEESKKLIAKAVLALPEVWHALNNGLVAIHPSSTTLFIYEALTGKLPEGVWVCGVIAPCGLTCSTAAFEMVRGRGEGKHDPREVSKQTWVFRNGVLQPQMPLGEILDEFGEDDVYIKTGNALDTDGNVGVLFGNPSGGGGTIGKVIIARKEKPFHIILPIGLEKLIPVPVAEAARKAGYKKANLRMGLPCGLIPVPGKKIDERDALSILSGASATPIASGGLCGAQGAVTLAIDGEKEAVVKAFDVVTGVKNASLPQTGVAEITAELLDY